MTTKKQSRIRWTQEEMGAVVEAAKQLVARGRKLTSEQRFAKAQSVLPKNRRRPYNANVGSWLSKVVKGEAAPVSGKAAASKPAKALIVNGGSIAPSITQSLIDAGVVILKHVLADEGVRRALRNAVK